MKDIDRVVIHPGGPRVLEAILSSTEFGRNRISESEDVFKNYGNLSSATVLFILKEIIDSKPRQGSKVLVFAVGPGFSFDFVMLEAV